MPPGLFHVDFAPEHIFEYVDIGGIDLLWFGQVGLLYVILRPTDPSHVFPQVGVGKEVV